MRKISTRIIIPVVILVIVIISSSSLIILSNFKTSLRSNAEERILTLTESKAQDIEKDIKTTKPLIYRGLYLSL